MGEIAEMMLDGLCCSECGVFFIEEHGYPVLCNSCHNGKSDLPRAFHKELDEDTIEESKEFESIKANKEQ